MSRKLWNVFPRSPNLYVSNRALRNAESFSDGCLRALVTSNLQNRLCCELRNSMPFAAKLPSLSLLVSSVFHHRSKKEMLRVATWRIIARMAYDAVKYHWQTVGKSISGAMDTHCLFVCAKRRKAITVSVFSSRPFNAPVIGPLGASSNSFHDPCAQPINGPLAIIPSLWQGCLQ
jgi:hypothetical protein